MIIYSVVPPEQIFDGLENHHPQYKEVKLSNGATMIVEPVSLTEGKIVRLISPRAEDYLNPRYTPGNRIFFRPDGL